MPGTTFTLVTEMMHEINMLFSEKFIPVELGVQGITSSAQEQIWSEKSQMIPDSTHLFLWH